MRPLDMDWRIGVSLITTFAAREVFVSSLALIFKVTDEENLQASILSAMRNARNEETGQKLFTTSVIIGLIVFFIFALQCISTIAVSKKRNRWLAHPSVTSFNLYIYSLFIYFYNSKWIKAFRC
jgi:ferrous iron transport protein B